MLSKKQKIRVGTRKSPLAIKQTGLAINKLKLAAPELIFELVEIGTAGDQDKQTPLTEFGQQGIFTNEVEEAILSGTIDFAVHSLKDLPVELAKGLVVDSFPERADPFDCLILSEARSLADVPSDALIGTSSLRREVELLRLRTDLRTTRMRGNIDNRLKQLKNGDFAGIILANAGLERLGWLNNERFTVIPFTSNEFMPSVGQGALALECREDDTFTRELLRKINHEPTERSVRSERQFMKSMNCHEEETIGAYGSLNQTGEIVLEVMYQHRGDFPLYERNRFIGSNPESVGQEAAAFFNLLKTKNQEL